MKRELTLATYFFTDGSSVVWRSLGKQDRVYTKETKYAIQVHVNKQPQSIDHFFESWDKPSEHRAVWFIKQAIKDAKQS